MLESGDIDDPNFLAPPPYSIADSDLVDDAAGVTGKASILTFISIDGQCA